MSECATGRGRTTTLVDVKQLEGMGEIAFDPDNGLRFGAAVTMNKVIASPVINAHYPLLAQAARTVASYQLRNRATIVGNLCNGSWRRYDRACLVLGAVFRGAWRKRHVFNSPHHFLQRSRADGAQPWRHRNGRHLPPCCPQAA
ncbi:MAG: FAD binding domain-containing protein [Chloroflexi bacterium]|nr:FAD binding domain-containing protein [Chloroflexota bacterium]